MASSPSPAAAAAPDLPTRALLSALASCLGAFLSHPLDILRARLQASPALSLRVQARALLLAGPRGVLVGLPASLARESTYSATRLSLYPLFKAWGGGGGGGGGGEGLAVLVAAGAAAGVCGSLVGNPADIIKTRQIVAASGGAAAPQRSLLQEGALIVREGGGARALWRGVVPAAQRAAAVTAGQLASYDVAKRELAAAAGLREGPALHAGAAAAASLCATASSMPFDQVKTAFYLSVGAGGQQPQQQRQGVAAALAGLVREGGVRALFRGFLPAYSRVGVHTLCTLTALEALRKAGGFAPL